MTYLKYDIRVTICPSSLRKGINGSGGRFVPLLSFVLARGEY